MKRIFCLLVALYVLFRIVYGQDIEIPRDEVNEIWSVGEKREILCISTQKNQKLRWNDPNGNEVDRRRVGNTRVYSQERPVHGSTSTLALMFTRVSVEDSGTWTCHAGDQALTTNVCVMDVATFVSSMTEVNIDLGRAITLTCEARGKPEPLMLWYRDGNLITDEYVKGESSKYKLMTKYNVQSQESLLTVSSLETTDAGIYVCTAIQDDELCMSNQTLSITLNLNHPPTILTDKMSETIYVNDGENVTLVCETEGYPLPEITWFQQYPDRDIKLDSSDDWAIIVEDNKSELQFLVNNRTAYESFLCIASNKYGEAEKLFKIVPLVAPVAPDKIALVNDTETELTIKAYWNSIEDGHAFPIKGMKVQYMTKSQVAGGRPLRAADWNRAKTASLDESDLSGDLEGTQFTLSGLSSDTTYWIRLRTFNDAGYSNWSKHVKFSTSPLIVTTEEAQVVQRVKDDVNGEMKNDDIEKATDAEVLPGTTDRIAISDETEDSRSPIDSSNFYALVFGVGIFVIIGGCTFIMKKM